MISSFIWIIDLGLVYLSSVLPELFPINVLGLLVMLETALLPILDHCSCNRAGIPELLANTWNHVLSHQKDDRLSGGLPCHLNPATDNGYWTALQSPAESLQLYCTCGELQHLGWRSGGRLTRGLTNTYVPTPLCTQAASVCVKLHGCMSY